MGFAKPSIASAGKLSVQEVTDWLWDDFQEIQERPVSVQSASDQKRRVRTRVHAVSFNHNQSLRTFWGHREFAQELPAGLGLKSGETDEVMFVSLVDKANQAAAKQADTVKTDDRLFSWLLILRVRHEEELK